jgi:hypothetical protein
MRYAWKETPMNRTTTLALCALIAVALKAPAPTVLAGDALPTATRLRQVARRR